MMLFDLKRSTFHCGDILVQQEQNKHANLALLSNLPMLLELVMLNRYKRNKMQHLDCNVRN